MSAPLDHSTIRMELLAEDAPLLEAIMGGAFGGAYSPHLAQNMFDPTHQEAIEDASARSRSSRSPTAPGWCGCRS